MSDASGKAKGKEASSISTHNTATERDEIDPIFKEVMTFNFGQLSLPVQTQVEVSRLPRTMDALVVLERAADREKVASLTAFDYFRERNQIEFKGKADPLTLAGYRLILGRANLYLGGEDISATQMTVTIISARQPRNVLYHSGDDVKWESQGGGRYKSIDRPFVHLFVCNELAITPKNYPLLLFAASKEKFRQFVEQIVSENNTIYIYYASRIEPEMTKEVLKMTGKQSAYEKSLQRIAQSMGEDLIPYLSEDEKSLQRITESMGEKVLERLPPEKRVRGLTLNERLDGLSLSDLTALSPENKEKLLQLLLTPDRKTNQTENVR